MTNNLLLFNCCVINDVSSKGGFKLFIRSTSMIGQYHPYLLAPDYISSFSLHYTCTLVICANLQFQAEEHSEEDKTKAEEADGQADQPSEQSSLPGRVVELLTARYGTAALHSLQRQQRKNSQGEFQRLFFMFVIILTGKWFGNVCAKCAPSLTAHLTAGISY